MILPKVPNQKSFHTTDLSETGHNAFSHTASLRKRYDTKPKLKQS